MAFVHVAFLGGAVLVAVPIILHLIMRQQPKHLEFPALRFIKLRETANKRQMRLRHWLLLALRAAAIGLLALALARPSIQSSGMLGDQEAPAAAALVFDTNPRMQYRQQNKTRLEAAQETAQWLLPQLPPESDVAVVDSRSGLAAFAVDASAARTRIERLDANMLTQPLATAIESALKLVHDSDKPRKEVYVFTDLARADWSAETMREVDSQLKEWRDIGVYIVDVGADDPSNVGVGETRLSAEVLSGRSPLRVAAELTHVGPAIQRAVELYLIDDSGEPRLRAQQQCAFRPGESQRVEFSLSGLTPGIHRGYLKVAGEDALACDDVHWFTVQVRPAWRVLLVGPHSAERQAKDYAFFLEEALAPDAFRVQGKAAFDCEVISTDQLAAHSLDDVAAVCLIDPDPLPATTWQKIHSYVVSGGGLGVFLGRNAARIQSFNDPVAQQLLAAALVRQWRGETRLAPDDFQHPIVRKFRALDVAWELSPVFHHWQLGPLNKESSVVVAYSDNQPALLERPVGKGRVITMTTPVSDPANRRDLWNQLPTGDEPVFVMLANEMLFYLVGRGQERLNYTAGETAVIHPTGGDRYPIYSLATPRGDQIRTPVDEKQNAIVITSTESPGNYRLQAGGGQQRADLGFSVNLPPDTSRLDRATKDDLAEMLPDVPFRLARNRDEIDRSVSAGRVGRELFPYLMLLLAIVLGCEQVLANRFYQDHDSKAPRSRAAELAGRAPTDHKPSDVPVSIR